jgi:hypothetical protein
MRTSPTTKPKIVCDKSPYHQNILMFKWHLKTVSHTHTHLRSLSIHFCYENVIVLMLKVKPMDSCDLWFYFCDLKHQFGTFEKLTLMICWSCYKTAILCVWNSTQMQEKENLFVARFFVVCRKNSPYLGIFLKDFAILQCSFLFWNNFSQHFNTMDKFWKKTLLINAISF